MTTSSVDLGYKGSYANYYVANGVVLVPNYNDPNDVVANGIIQGLYLGRTAVGIDVRNLYENGGMVHCVTQQQPLGTVTGLIDLNSENEYSMTVFPNPFNNSSTIQLNTTISNGQLNIYNAYGQQVKQINNISGKAVTLSRDNLPRGLYFIQITRDNNVISTNKIIITD